MSWVQADMNPLKMIASKDSMSILCAVSSYSLVIVLA
jgi:hypothetical protein